ncbi:SDR family NAD(P)-dependent oxidoreductase [Amnibacterium kyonggiense]|uniref:Short-subunit dehydrogenase n=1 Tax=Amnibacterium kyonggiense TaxID=595671 RepID=A0A4R7FDI8_9MICO|nr:SDR family NAD(P)-dependent oxidoreductase [Amnibacterium kyonggiense]TDS75029.1 short-subunit dehydrogenase [Amnibacterium kyonggiense]
MDLELEGRLAIVTGASRGIGLAVTRALVDEGAVVVTGSRSVPPALQTLADAGRVHPVEVDLATEGGPAELVARAAELGDVDVLVNNAGAVAPRTDGFLAVSDGDWRRTFELDLFAALRAIRAVLPGMVERGRGAVVSIASVNAYLPDPVVVDYSAAKAALWNISKSLSKEFGPAGIRFNTISPGPVETDLWLGGGGVASTLGAASGVDPESVVRAARAGFSTGRFTRPEEVADLVLLLAGGRAGNVTGADLRIDGGLVQTL